jgi:hypothetical protein
VAYHMRKWSKLRLAVGLVAVLLSALTGCSPDSLTSGSPPLHSNLDTPGPTGAAVAPAPTVTAVVPTPIWNVRCTAHALPRGWTWYRDARYPFRVAVPPTWRPGSFAYVPDGSGLGAASPSYIHVVDFFGPGSDGQAQSNGGKDRFDISPPVIIIEAGVGLQARLDGFTQNAAYHAQPTPVCVGGTPVTLYVYTYVATDEEGSVGRAALLPAGPQGFPYTFTAFSRAGTAARDGALFLTMLGTFGPVVGD